jgi:hypothetical protein
VFTESLSVVVEHDHHRYWDKQCPEETKGLLGGDQYQVAGGMGFTTMVTCNVDTIKIQFIKLKCVSDCVGLCGAGQISR